MNIIENLEPTYDPIIHGNINWQLAHKTTLSVKRNLSLLQGDAH